MKTLRQIKQDAARGDWGIWCKHWGAHPINDIHPNDERALLDGCYFDLNAAERLRKFFRKHLRIPGTDPTGPKTVPFDLLDWWYRDYFGPLFGWKRKDGRRRFDKSFATTAKKSGKSSGLSGLPLYMMTADGEEEAECYSTAVDRDQAGIIFRKADRMRKMSKTLSGMLKSVPSQKRIIHEESGSFYEAISSDADSADGANPHLLIVDELHRWRTREFFETLMYGDIARMQALFLMITTSGDDPSSICYEEYQFAKELLDPDNDTYSMSHHAVIHEASQEKNWDDPEGWKEANPSLLEGLGSIEKLQAKCDEAKKSPRKKRYFIRTICNRWLEGVEDVFLCQDGWKKCGELGDVSETPFTPKSTNRWLAMLQQERDSELILPTHYGEPCAGGLDLSSSVDLTALCLAFDGPGGRTDLKWWFWLPEEGIKEKEERDRVPYRDWVAEGWIELTPGFSVNYNYIRRRISGVELDEEGKPKDEKFEGALATIYLIQEIAYDRWGSAKLITELEDYDDVPMTPMGQGFASMSQPCKDFQSAALDGKIGHGNNPVVDWMSRHAICDEDAAGNLKLNKKKSRHRIDGIQTAVMAKFLLANPSEGSTSSGSYSGKGTGMWD